MNYPCITLHQPWASWIAWGLKTIETRTHNRFASLRGQRIAIHAGQAWSDHALDEAANVMTYDKRPADMSGVQFAERNIARRKKMWGRDIVYVRGAVVCLATVEDIRQLDSNDSQAALCFCGPSLNGLILADVEPLAEPFKVRGQQGIWRVEIPDES